MLISLLLMGCYSVKNLQDYVPTCEGYGEIVYTSSNVINSQEEAEELFKQYRPSALPRHLIRKIEPPEETTQMSFYTVKTYDQKVIRGWIPSPYGYAEHTIDGVTSMRGLFIGQDGNIYSFQGCQ